MPLDEKKPRPIAALIAETRLQAASAPISAAPTNNAIDGYQLIHEIHRGGQGVVYLARQIATQRDVAIKMMRDGPFASAGERARFEREAHILASIKHPHIVTIHDSGSAEGNDYFVMDYIAGVPLDRWADATRPASDAVQAKSNLPPAIERIVEALAKICDAVAMAHQSGVIHRDLKPTNIRMDENDQPFVLDFGLAKSSSVPAASDLDTSQGKNQITASGQFLGTLPWSSPEQVSEKSHLADTRSDVYALGLMLYRALTGRMPYATDTALSDMIQVIAEKEPAPMSQFVGGIDTDLETITRKCLAKEADRRYQTAGELGADLRRYLQCEPIIARPVSALYTLRMFARRHRALAASLLAFLVLLVGSSASMAFLYTKAKKSERLAESHAKQTKRVAEFQNAQLSGINPEAMGHSLRQSLIRLASSPNELTGPEAGDSAAAAEGDRELVEQAIAGVNFTDVAMKMLNDNVFSSAVTAAQSRFADQPLLQAEFLHNTAETMTSLGLTKQAIEPQSLAVDLRRQYLGDTHDETLQSRVGLARLMSINGNQEQAESIATDVLRRAESQEPINHQIAVSAETTQGRAHFQRGEYAMALQCYEAAMQRAELHLEDEGVELRLAAQSGAGVTLQTMERFDEATALHNVALESSRRHYGEDHLATLVLLQNLASLEIQRGNSSDGIKLYRETIEKFKSQLGEDHELTLGAMSNLTEALGSSGGAFEATVLLDRIVKSRARLQGPLHLDTLNATSEFANALSRMGQHERAFNIQKQVVADFRRAVGDMHPHTLRAINGLAMAYQGIGKNDEAEVLFRESIEGNRAVIGNQNTETLQSIGNLGNLLLSKGDLDGAEPLLLEAAEGTSQVLGNAHAVTIVFQVGYAKLLKRRKRFDEALEIAEQAWQSSLSARGKDHLPTHNVESLVGSLYMETADYEAALTHFQSALEGYARIVGEKHPYTLTVRRSVAQALEKLQRTDEGLNVYREVLDARREVLPEGDADRFGSAADLGLLLAEVGQLEEAKPLLFLAAQKLPDESYYRSEYKRVLETLLQLIESEQLEQSELPEELGLVALRTRFDGLNTE